MEEQTKCPWCGHERMPGVSDGHLARITGRLLPMNAKFIQIFKVLKKENLVQLQTKVKPPASRQVRD